MKCEKCGITLSKDIKFCPECGTPVPKPIPIPTVQEKKEFPPILTIDQAAEFLCVSRCHVYTLIKKEGLPWFPMGTCKRFLTDELLSWSKSKMVVQQAV